MIFLEILDRLLQFIGHEIIEGFIDWLSKFLASLVRKFPIKWKKTNNLKYPKIAQLHRSENFLIVNKPPDIVLNSNDPAKISMQTLLKAQYPELHNSKLGHEFYFAHRLDFSTSGVLCVPLNKEACQVFSKSMEDRTSKKFYVALLNGHIAEDTKTIELDIGEDSRSSSNHMCSSLDAQYCLNPRRSLTHLATVANGYFGENPVTKVLIRAITGRRHQIRVHCRAIGHPILGDYTYGSLEDQKLSRMYLHAIRMIVPNSIENVFIETPDPFTEDKLDKWKSNQKTINNLEIFYKILENK